jgi:mono/diheme cytochrome c family protein
MLAAGVTPPRADAFPAEQLARGEAVWKSICSRCHGPDSDNPDAPLLLRPNAFKTFANGADLFHYVQGSMPGDEPSSLADEQYWDVLAFLLSQQGITNGDTPLGPESAMGIPTTKVP